MIIKGDWRRALKREARWLPVLLPMATLAIWFDQTKREACASLFGIHRIEIAMAMLFYGFPIVFFLGSLFGVRIGLRLLQGDHWPPLDHVPFVDTLAKKGRVAHLRGWLFCVMPVLLFGFALFAHYTFVQLLAGRHYSDVRARLESGCQVLPPK